MAEALMRNPEIAVCDIRPARADDERALVVLIEKAGLFTQAELGGVASSLAEAFQGTLVEENVWLVAERDGVVGVAYYAPEMFTVGTWNLYMLAVDPERRSEGIGHELVRYVEDALRATGERLLLVETSGLPGFARTRAFYRDCGFEEEGRVRDFYKAGDDKVIFRKVLC